MKDLFNFFNQQCQMLDFDVIKIVLVLLDLICLWFFGEVKKLEIINYCIFKLECDGLFCVVIFGLVKDYECLCGKYKCMKYRGVVCEKCGIEVILVKVCCECMGYIDLVLLVVYIWFFKLLLLCIGLMLDMILCDIECVLYFEVYVVIELGLIVLECCQLLIEEQYLQVCQEYGDDFDVVMGVEVVYELLCMIDLQFEMICLCEEIVVIGLEIKFKCFIKCIKLIEVFLELGNCLEWMVMIVLLVLLLDLCLLVLLDGGCFVIFDLNDLYCCVINCNNCLCCLFELSVLDIIVCNEKCMLQELVDVLLDNGCRGCVIIGINKCLLKLLVDMIKGKQGCFCQNLFGKCVDYLGCLVIVVGLYLCLYQCGLLKKMVLELFKLFVFVKLQCCGLVIIIKVVKKLVECEEVEVWDILEEVICEYLVMLNCVLILYCLGIQVFELVLIEGKVIQLYLLVCIVFNVDFDGDQMVVYVLFLLEVQLEVCVLMMLINNILLLVNGELIIVLLQDVVLGLYYMICLLENKKGEGMVFVNIVEVKCVYDNCVVELYVKVKVCIIEVVIDEDGNKQNRILIVDIMIGCVLLVEILLEGLLFVLVNVELIKKNISCLINFSYCQFGLKDMVVFVDKLMYIGFVYVICVGVLIGIDDMLILDEKKGIFIEVEVEVLEIQEQYQLGLVIVGECYNKVVDIWLCINECIVKVMMDIIGIEKVVNVKGEIIDQKLMNLLYIMVDFGVCGLQVQICQLVGMCGLMVCLDGLIIEMFIKVNFCEGLNVQEYFNFIYGVCKGLVDIVLKIVNLGYLICCLVDVVQDVVIIEVDCGIIEGLIMILIVEGGDVVELLKDCVLGCVVVEDVFLLGNDEDLIVICNILLDEVWVVKLEDVGVQIIKVCLIIFCELVFGVCLCCYGCDLVCGYLVNIGEVVGVIVVQFIGELGIQLIMCMFYIGGVVL